MGVERHVKLVRDGDHQSIQIPAEFELPGEEVIIRREGKTLVIEPSNTKDFFEWLATIEPWDEEFPDVKDGLPPLKDINL